jgi:hypothetical protein
VIVAYFKAQSLFQSTAIISKRSLYFKAQSLFQSAVFHSQLKQWRQHRHQEPAIWRNFAPIIFRYCYTSPFGISPLRKISRQNMALMLQPKVQTNRDH